MAMYRFAGGHPVPDGEGGMVRPGDERDEVDLPDFGPWEPVPVLEPDEPEAAQETPPPSTPPPPPATPPAPQRPPAASTPPPAAEGK